MHVTLCAPRVARSTLRAIRSPPTRTRNHNAPTRPDAACPSARRRLALASGSRVDRTAPCATHCARNILRATLRAQHIARHTRSTHTHTRKPTNAPTHRDAAVLSARRRLALASGSRADRTAPCATHCARNTLRATRSPHTRTKKHERLDAPRRCGLFSPPPVALAYVSRADRTEQCAAHRACATRHARNLARRRSLSHTHTHHHERSDAPRCSRRPAHRRLALASGSRADRTAQCAAHHARSSLRAVCSSHARTHNRAQHATHATQCAPSDHHTHNALLAKRRTPKRSPSATT